jgi:hypothetical protein
MHFYRRLVEWAVALLREGVGRVIFMQTSFSSFQAVEHLFQARGFSVRTLFSHKRRQSLSQIDELAPGCGDWLQRLREAGSADFAQEPEANGDISLIYEQRIAVAERGAGVRAITRWIAPHGSDVCISKFCFHWQKAAGPTVREPKMTHSRTQRDVCLETWAVHAHNRLLDCRVQNFLLWFHTLIESRYMHRPPPPFNISALPMSSLVGLFRAH